MDFETWLHQRCEDDENPWGVRKHENLLREAFDAGVRSTKPETFTVGSLYVVDLDGGMKPSLGDCVSCDGYVLSAAEFPHCPTCARLTREGKPL